MLFSINTLGFNKQKSPERCLWIESFTENIHEGNGTPGRKKIPKATWEHVVFGLGLSIETCKGSIPELLGKMLCVMGSTNCEFHNGTMRQV